MPEQSYPIPCQSCGKQLYGPVTYCPYCAVKCAVATTVETTEESEIIDQVNEATVATPSPESFSGQQPPPSQDEPTIEGPSESTQKVAPENKPAEQKSEPASEKKVGKLKVEPAPPVPPPPPPKPWKWIAVAVVLVVVIAGYLISHKKGGVSSEPSGSQQSSTSSAPSQGKKESARIVAQDAMRQGTGLSLTISKLPKLEKVLKAAKQLGDISPRYQEQIASAENTLKAAQTDRDKSLLAYIGKVEELGRYKPDQISYAMGVIQSGDITSREKVVAELLSRHVNSLRSSGNSDPKKLLSEFNHRFSDFVD